MMTQLDVENATEDTTAPGHVTHIVLEGSKLPDGEFLPTGDSVVAGFVNGTPVTALCGAVIVPRRDPSKHPLCQACVGIAKGMGWSLPSR